MRKERNTFVHLLFSFYLILSVITRVSSSRSCLQVRGEALADLVKTEVVIVPDCDPFNPHKFSSVQCHNSTGYCWCVDPTDGKPIPNTSVRRENPDCNGRRDNLHLRSRSIRKEPTSSSSCDQNAFASNLLALMKNEFRAVNKATSSDIADRRVLNWKFQRLDINHDGQLQRRELRTFRKTAKTSVEPRACAKLWLRALDQDQNKLIVKSEWTDYFTPKSPINSEGEMSVDQDGNVNGNLSPHAPPKSGMNPLDFLAAVHSRVQSSSSSVLLSSSLSESSTSRSPMTSSANFAPDPLTMLSESRSKDLLEGEGEEEEEEEEVTLSSGKDCFSARQQAESSRVKNPSSKTYIPICTESGKYEEVQCYREFCWCVDVNKGLPLKGSVGSEGSSSKPNCKHAKPLKKTKDCPREQKIAFLRLLTALFTNEMLNKQNSRGRRVTDQVLQWKFNQMDKNRDEKIDVSEWKLFKRSIRGSKDSKSRASAPSNDSKFDSVRHCFKLFFQGCDLNRDKIITKPEWFDCTGKNLPQDNLTEQRTKNTNLNTGRRGPNPFQTILKAD